MSLRQLVYLSAMIAGWAALLGWLLSEWLFFSGGSEPGFFQQMLLAGIIGAAVGLALNVIAGMANGQWKQLALRALPGLIGGCLGGAAGTLVGNVLYLLGLPRAIGWLVFGLGIGSVEGLYDRSASKLRNGLIGGGVGGLLGGLLFDPIQAWVATPSGMTARAAGFVILGVCIGTLIGLAQVVLKRAWLTVLDGYRSGRQLILSRPVTLLGRAEHLPLPFLGPMNRGLELEHVRIIRRPGGGYVVEDNHTQLGTRVNNQPVQGQVVLRDGDVIKLGTNYVRFNQRGRKAGEESPGPAAASPPQATPAPPPAVRKPSAPGTTPRPGPSPPPSPPATPGPRPASGIAPPPPPRRPKPKS